MKKAVVLALAALMVLGVAGAAFAEPVLYPGAGPAPWKASNSSDPVEVRATVNPKITLTVTTPDASQSVEWLNVDPDSTVAGKQVGLLVSSNKKFDLAITQSDGTFTAANGITFSRDLTPKTAQAKGKAVAFTDNYSLTTTYDTEPGTYTGTVTYTVTQVN